PFASTLQGAASGGPYSARAVNDTHNSLHGTSLGSFYRDERIASGDQFFVRITDGPGLPVPGGGGGGSGGHAMMVVGDSITQGFEGDYTWRYRLASHLASTGGNTNFVGPNRGT